MKTDEIWVQLCNLNFILKGFMVDFEGSSLVTQVPSIYTAMICVLVWLLNLSKSDKMYRSDINLFPFEKNPN